MIVMDAVRKTHKHLYSVRYTTFVKFHKQLNSVRATTFIK